MEWTSIDVESDKDVREEFGGLADLKVGLDTDAESMHREFMKGLPHLSDVQEMHSSVVSEIESRALSDEISSLGEFGSGCHYRTIRHLSPIRIPLVMRSRRSMP